MSASPTPDRGWALVTGAGKRLGRASALALAGAGYDVVVHYNASAAEAADTADAIKAMGRRAVPLGCDLSDATAVAALIANASEAAGPLTALINSASMFEHDVITDLTRAGFDRHMSLNTFAPLQLTQGFAAHLPQGAHGVVINFLDFKLVQPYPDHLSYTLSKYALMGATELLARALAPAIRVNAVSPGYTLPSPGQSEADFQRLHGQTPLGYGATPDHVGQAVAFLATNLALTGQTILVDAGLHFRSVDRDMAFQ